MIINWYGHSCFKITNQGGHLIVLTDPFDKKTGLNPPRCSADIVTVSHQHYDHNNVKAITGMEGSQPFIIDSAGEYEIKGVSIVGCRSFHDQEKKEQNIIYVMEIDKIRICHLGDFGQDKLEDKQIEKIGNIDILMIPVGGNCTIEAKRAVKIVNQIEPRIIIPMHYNLPGIKIKLDDVKDFLKEMGLNGIEAVDKLTIKKKDLIGKEMEVILMKP
ncbi:MAG: MBL fold metallo-hydrolase [Patescibacteria group bacterium]|nr:MBL fold metallo-hydrolase [Patescibacteria group bacterium]